MLRHVSDEVQEGLQKACPDSKCTQVEPFGQEALLQSDVQAPSGQWVGPDDPSSGVHSPDAHSTFQVQGAPMGPGVTDGGSHVPVLALHVRVLPHDQPRRQSGKQAPTAVEQT